MNIGPETSEPDSVEIMERAHEHGINLFDTADAYGGKKGEGVTAPITGPRTVAQLDGSVRAVEIILDAEVLARLDELFPPPGPNGGRPAPEAYAW
ncbi:MAG: aldo/keto reductase [Pseudonocardiaceae bacterium]